MHTSNYSEPVKTISERFTRDRNGGENYIGYEVNENYISRTSSIPKCSYCFQTIRYPNATNINEFKQMLKHELEEKSNQKRKNLISDCKSKIEKYSKPVTKEEARNSISGKYDWGWEGCLVLSSIPIGIVIMFFNPLGYLIIILGTVLTMYRAIYSGNKVKNQVKKLSIERNEKKMMYEKELNKLQDDKNLHLWRVDD